MTSYAKIFLKFNQAIIVKRQTWNTRQRGPPTPRLRRARHKGNEA